MAHKVFAIDKFLGENTNQPGRAHNMPQELIGRFVRTGGYAPLINRDIVDNDMWRLGDDWLGFSAWWGGIPAQFEIRYAQTGMAATNPGNELVAPHDRLLAPGGGIFGIDGVLTNPSEPLLRDPSITAAFFVQAQGWGGVYRTPLGAGYAPTISHVAGDFTSGSNIYVVFIYFEPTPHGLIPVELRYATDTLSNDNSGWQITRTSFSTIEGRVLYAYARIYDAETDEVVEWTVLDRSPDNADNPFNNGGGLMVERLSDWPQNAQPVFYGIPADSVHDSHSRFTFAVGRAFYTADEGHVWILSSHRSYPNEVTLRSPRSMGLAYTRQGVFYTDIIGNEGHIAFSDNPNGPNYLRFDDIIYAITPSNRGIYAFSGMATWEAYGDFVSASNTRISLVPVLGGVDHLDDAVTFSGDTAYFVKDGIVHSIGPAGVKQIGRAERLYERTDEIQDIGDVVAITYDRGNRRLFALRRITTTTDSGYTIDVYDPSLGGWYTWVNLLHHTTATEVNIVPLGSGQYRTCRRDITEAHWGTPVPLRVNWVKCDCGEPSLRKRIHRILLPYIGNYDSVDTFRLYNSDSHVYRDCTVNDQGEYFEVRCPSMVARAFDLLIQITSSDEAFAINPPLIVEFETREAGYGAQ